MTKLLRRCGACLFGAWLLTVAIGPASSQTLVVRSGEHDDFTRLVVDIGPGRTWEMDRRSTQDVHIGFTPSATDFQLDQVFDLIPRTRLRALAERDGLALSLECDCLVTTERYRERYLIVDIIDRSETEQNEIENERARQLAASEALPDLGSLALGNRDTGRPVRVDAMDVQETRNEAPGAALEEAARIMSEQLARAAAAGLLEPATVSGSLGAMVATQSMEPTDVASVSTTPQPTPLADIAPAPSLALPNNASLGGPAVTAENAFDIALNTTDQRGAPGFQASDCNAVPSEVGSWASGYGFYHELGSIRLALYSEDGTLDLAQAETLARHYLYYGFGAEAANLLRQLPDPPDALLRLAQLVDGEDVTWFSGPEDLDVCTDQAVFWSYAMDQDIVLQDRNQARRLQRAASALPMGLQDRLLPDIARRLFQDGFPNEARNLRDALLRGQRLLDADLFALDLDLGLLSGGHDPNNRERLAAALRDDGGAPHHVMAHALRYDRQFSNGTSNTRLIAAEALLRESGGASSSSALWHEIVLAHAERSNIDAVLNYMQTETSDRVRQLTLTDLFNSRLNADDTASLYILALVFGPEWSGSDSEVGRTRVAAISHLRTAGLTQAVDALRSGHQPLILPERPNARAAVAVAAETAWQAADWDEIAREATSVHRDIAERMQALTQSNPQAVHLSGLAEQVADTRDLRGQILALLQDPSPSREVLP